MIIKAKNLAEGLQSMKHEGDFTKFNHLENITGILEHAHRMRNDGNNGWTKGRTQRKIASLPSTTILKHPELLADKTGTLMRKFLKSEGAQFLCVKKNSI